MKFEWDENKRKSNLSKHGIDFQDTQQIISGIIFAFEDERYNYGEYRFIALGMLRGMVVIVAHIERKDVIRLIAIQKVTKN